MFLPIKTLNLWKSCEISAIVWFILTINILVFRITTDVLLIGRKIALKIIIIINLITSDITDEEDGEDYSDIDNPSPKRMPPQPAPRLRAQPQPQAQENVDTTRFARMFKYYAVILYVGLSHKHTQTQRQREGGRRVQIIKWYNFICLGNRNVISQLKKLNYSVCFMRTSTFAVYHIYSRISRPGR